MCFPKLATLATSEAEASAAFTANNWKKPCINRVLSLVAVQNSDYPGKHLCFLLFQALRLYFWFGLEDLGNLKAPRGTQLKLIKDL